MNSRSPVFLLVLALAACSVDEHQDLKQWMAEASEGMHGRVQPIPEIKPFPVVSYDAGDLPEPFSPSKAMPENVRAAAEFNPTSTGRGNRWRHIRLSRCGW